MSSKSLDQILRQYPAEQNIKYSLDRLTAALTYIGNPEQQARAIIVGGTNGKGTTALFISAALAEAGHRVGTYLSPHLQHVEERFATGLCVEDGGILDPIAVELLPVATRFELSYFEFLTLIAFAWSSHRKHDYLVLEVGMGGRLDATNLCNPLASVITTIGLDHENYLGTTPAAILAEKLGIVRPESLLFSAVAGGGLRQQIESHCNELDSIYYFSTDLSLNIEDSSWHEQTIRINGYPFVLSNPSGAAAANARLAFLVMRIVFPVIPISVLSKAFAQVLTPGRMEVVSHKPKIILSGDHNPQGMASLSACLETLAQGKVHVLCGFSPDKPAVQMITQLRNFCTSITLTKVPRFDKTEPDKQAIELCDKYIPDAELALDDVVARIESDDDVCIVTGSLYLVGALRKRFRAGVRYSVEDGQASLQPSGHCRDRSTQATTALAEPEQTTAQRS